MPNINPYIHFNGNAAEAFEFYKSVFGGEFAMLIRYKDMPTNPEYPIPVEESDKIAHIALPIGNQNVLMASDTPTFMGKHNENETRSKIFVSADSKEQADTFFTELTQGGTIEVPINNSDWGSYFGMLRDKFGIEWMVDFNPNYTN